MTVNQAQTAVNKLNSEGFDLSPSALITLFEINIWDLAFDLDQSITSNLTEQDYIFRFHNCLTVTKNSIIFNGIEYSAAPIHAEGFEANSRGKPTSPKLSITSNEDGLPLIAALKQKVKLMQDLIGAKVTRIRTFAKYIDAVNFVDGFTPDGFSPDPTVRYPEDVYYIERKSQEDKFGIEFELTQVLDVENIKLPGRLVMADKCAFRYRGKGCCWEYSSRRNAKQHGAATLPVNAPSKANVHDELISKLIGTSNFIDRGQYIQGNSYAVGDQVYITKNDLNYYFVCKQNTNYYAPPNLQYWILDDCSRLISGCKLRWSDVDNGLGVGVLPFGGFPAVNKTVGVQ